MIPRLCLLGLLWFFLLFFGACKKHSSTRFITSDLVILQNAQVAEQPGFESEEPFPITLIFALVDDASQPNQEIASDFITHQTCTACHNSNGLDINTELTTGANVSPADGWRATLMANAFRDPYFRARLLSEVNVFPSQAGRIQNECLTCHTPMLSAQIKEKNGEDATIDFLLASSSGLGRDGISCTLCHQIQDDEDLETAFNGNLPLNTTKDIMALTPIRRFLRSDGGL
jgi:hypothetical protein